MSKKIIKTAKAPAAIGPYNQAIVHNDVVYVSGQIAIDPSNGELVVGDIEMETRQVLNNLTAILEEAGSGMEYVLKCSVFVKDMEQYSRINAIYAEFFPAATAPARELVQVCALPKYVNVEISAIATIRNK